MCTALGTKCWLVHALSKKFDMVASEDHLDALSTTHPSAGGACGSPPTSGISPLKSRKHLEIFAHGRPESSCIKAAQPTCRVNTLHKHLGQRAHTRWSATPARPHAEVDRQASTATGAEPCGTLHPLPAAIAKRFGEGGGERGLHRKRETLTPRARPAPRAYPCARLPGAPSRAEPAAPEARVPPGRSRGHGSRWRRPLPPRAAWKTAAAIG